MIWSTRKVPKAENIRAAVAAVATRTWRRRSTSVIPVCLAEGRAYNVDDALWAAILAQQDEAGRVRLLRCLEARKRAENWTLLGRQLANAGTVPAGFAEAGAGLSGEALWVFQAPCVLLM
jgi:hypothetical protein